MLAIFGGLFLCDAHGTDPSGTELDFYNYDRDVYQ